MRSSPRPANRAAAYRFWRRWLGPAVLAAAVSAAGGAHADDGVLTWIVKMVSDDDDGIVQASAMRVPQEGTALVTGQQISTGAKQQMILVHGRDLVEIKPNSTIVIGDDDAATSTANVGLINGTIHVQVGKRSPGTTFSIDAPYLIATVKGTQFDVTSSSSESRVSVTEGVVAVSADASGTSVDVTVGNTAIVRRNADQPILAPTKASSTPSTIEVDKNIESASTDNGDAGGSNSGGSNSGGSNSGGSNSSGSNSGSGGVGGAVGGATGAVGDAVGGAADAVGDAVSGATGALGGAVGGPVGGAVAGVGGAVGGAVSGVGGAAGGAVGGVGGAVGGLLGGGR